ncbi:MAG TPA: hypothetical protein ENJ95_24600 [Bacteroidetes bacterium]|nr:hypothetical protein [Bacteroidota bacterium]
MPIKLSFEEVTDWKKFESLVGAYFENIKKEDNEVFEVETIPSGEGSDGGQDILITFLMRDSISTFKRKWVV